MSAVRPSDYHGKSVVYGLHDGNGNIFYVGQSRSFSKRMSSYSSGHCHNNRALRSKLKECGLHWVVLCVEPDDLNAAEFDEIEARQGLVNIVTDRNLALSVASSDKPWMVKGARSPSTQYLHVMNSRFQKKMPEIKAALKRMNDEQRLEAECRFAETLIEGRVEAAHVWVQGMIRKGEMASV